MIEGLYPAGLYDAKWQPVGDTLPYWEPSLLDPNGPRQEWVAVWPLGKEWECAPVLTWLAPIGPFKVVPGLVVAEMVAAVDAGRSVMAWGSDEGCMAEVGRLIGGLSGGGHA
jgi:hypothetical protein